MVLRLCVPLIHSLLVRNWNLAASGAAFTASSVAKRVAVSTPLRMDSLTVVPVICVLLRAAALPRGLVVAAPVAVRSYADERALAYDRAGGKFRRLGFDGRAEPPLEL